MAAASVIGVNSKARSAGVILPLPSSIAAPKRAVSGGVISSPAPAQQKAGLLNGMFAHDPTSLGQAASGTPPPP